MLTATTLAAILDGGFCGNELPRNEAERAQASGLVVVFGESDDKVVMRGAIHNEIYAFNGVSMFVNQAGLIVNECIDAHCPHFSRLLTNAAKVEALWAAGPDYSWTFSTTIPHEKFTILDCEGQKFCAGIVFSLAEARPARSSFEHLLADLQGMGLAVIGQPLLHAALNAANDAHWQTVLTSYAEQGRAMGIRFVGSAMGAPAEESLTKLLSAYQFSESEAMRFLGNITYL